MSDFRCTREDEQGRGGASLSRTSCQLLHHTNCPLAPPHGPPPLYSDPYWAGAETLGGRTLSTMLLIVLSPIAFSYYRRTAPGPAIDLQHELNLAFTRNETGNGRAGNLHFFYTFSSVYLWDPEAGKQSDFACCWFNCYPGTHAQIATALATNALRDFRTATVSGGDFRSWNSLVMHNRSTHSL